MTFNSRLECRELRNAHRDRTAKEVGAELIVYTNAEGLAQNINPFDHGSNKYTTVMKSEQTRLNVFDLLTQIRVGVQIPERRLPGLWFFLSLDKIDIVR